MLKKSTEVAGAGAGEGEFIKRDGDSGACDEEMGIAGAVENAFQLAALPGWAGVAVVCAGAEPKEAQSAHTESDDHV